MFGSVVDKIGTVVSRSFLLSSFFPFLIFAAINIAVTWFAFPNARWVLDEAIKLEAGKQAMVLGTTFIAIAVVAYLFSPLTLLLRQVLEGRVLIPRFIQDGLREEQFAIAQELKEKRDRANTRDNDIAAFFQKQLERLIEARRTGSALKALGPSAQAQICAADAEITAVERIATPRRTTETATITALEGAISTIVMALSCSSTTLPETAPECDHALSKKLAASQAKATVLLRRAVDDAHQALIEAQEILRGRFALKGIWPTHIANIRAAAESHSVDAYGVEFEFIWPRLRFAMQKDEKAVALLDGARAQVDFSLLMTLLCGTFVLVWLSIFIGSAQPPLAIIMLGLAGLMVISFLLRVVEESIKQLGELISSTVDLYRFKLLREMDIDPPGNLTAERALWRRLQQSSTTGLGTIDIAYRHGKS